MKYIKLFEERLDVKKYFRDKIDWSFINYLQYKLTKYEDMDCAIEVNIDIYDSENKKVLHVYRFGNGGNSNRFMDYVFTEEYIPAYEKYGLIYEISLYGKDTNGRVDFSKSLTNEFYNEISDKCYKFSAYDENRLFVNPKIDRK